MSEISQPVTKSFLQSRQIILAIVSLLMFLKSKFNWSWLPASIADAEDYATVIVAIGAAYLSIRERLHSDHKQVRVGPVLSKVFITPNDIKITPPPASVGLLFLIFAPLMLVGCSILGPTAEEAFVLKDATNKMVSASVQSEKVYRDSLKAFRDELITRSFGEIEQAERDEIATAAQDGLYPEEANAISKHGRDLREEALKHINAAYDTALEHPAHEQFEKLQQRMAFYWLTRLSNDQLKAQLLDQIKALAPKEE